MKFFSVESKKDDIQAVLDEELDISRYYADLVPISVKPDHFWGRYFFRVHLVENDGELGLDEVVEEEGNWDDTPATEDGASGGNEAETKVAQYLKENVTLKSHVRVLTARVKELEAELAQAKKLGYNPGTVETKPVVKAAVAAPAPAPAPAPTPTPAPTVESEEAERSPVLSSSQVIADLGALSADEEDEEWA